MRPLYLMVRLLVPLGGCFFGLAAPAQPSAGAATAEAGCDLATMPALPPGADAAPAARAGYEWTPGHYRCLRSGWSYQAGYWRRAGSRVEASALVVARNGGIVPRPGYQFIRQGNGVALARIAGGGRGGVGVTETINCVCTTVQFGSCVIVFQLTSASCQGSNTCATCRLILNPLPAGGGVIRYAGRGQLPVYLETDCSRGGHSRVAAAP